MTLTTVTGDNNVTEEEITCNGSYRTKAGPSLEKIVGVLVQSTINTHINDATKAHSDVAVLIDCCNAMEAAFGSTILAVTRALAHIDSFPKEDVREFYKACITDFISNTDFNLERMIESGKMPDFRQTDHNKAVADEILKELSEKPNVSI
jgi:hypothetical protein